LTSAEPGHSLAHRSALSEPLFRRFFPASCFSTLGSWLVRFLFGFSAWEQTHSAFWVGVVAGVMLLPAILLSPLFGIVSDRINPRNGLLVTVAGHGLVATLAALANLAGAFTLTTLVALAGLLGAATSAHTPIRLALVPRLVIRQALPSAIGFSAMIFNTSRIAGPALGAWLIAGYSLSTALFAATVLFLCALPFLLSISGITVTARPEPGSFLVELRAGLSYAASHPLIRRVLGLTLINALLGRTLLELLPALSGQLLDGTAETLATLSATGGIGSIIGGLVISRQGSDEGHLLKLIAWSLLVCAGSLLSVHWLDGLVAFCLLVLVVSLLTTVVGTSCQALAQLKVDEAYRGRVLSLWTVLAMGAPAIGAIAVGALAESFGFAVVLVGSAMLSMVVLTRLAASRST